MKSVPVQAIWVKERGHYSFATTQDSKTGNSLTTRASSRGSIGVKLSIRGIHVVRIAGQHLSRVKQVETSVGGQAVPRLTVFACPLPGTVARSCEVRWYLSDMHDTVPN